MAYDSVVTKLQEAVSKRKGQRFEFNELLKEINTKADGRRRVKGAITSARAMRIAKEFGMVRLVEKQPGYAGIWEAI